MRKTAQAPLSIRFECQRCGRCCHTRADAGIVALTPADRERLADHLGLTPAAFLRRYTLSLGKLIHLRDGEPGACILLEDGGCAAYPARPLQCRTWPFWPEHLVAGAFEREVGSFCPGAGQGEEWDPEAVRTIARIQRKADRRS
jgi:Fe-S-cluster containining protein